MGIKDFYKFINTKYPECFRPVYFSSYRYQTIAIDMMNLLYVYKARNNHDWMKNVLLFLIKLQNQYVHPICVFDGRSHPLKKQTIQKRREDRNKGLNRIKTIQESLQIYRETKTIDETLYTFLKNKHDFTSQLSPDMIFTERIEDYLQKQLENYSLFFSSADIAIVREFIENMGIRVLDAKYDGEALCSYLSKIGKVSAVITNDSDVFFFGCQSVICKFIDEGGLELNIESILEKLEIDFKQFIDLCILCGTDFNESIRGYGFVRSLGLIQRYGDLETIRSNITNMVLDMKLIEEIKGMTNVYFEEDWKINLYNTQPNLKNLELLLSRHQVNIPLEAFEYKFNQDISIDEL